VVVLKNVLLGIGRKNAVILKWKNMENGLKLLAFNVCAVYGVLNFVIRTWRVCFYEIARICAALGGLNLRCCSQGFLVCTS
jgi:hypothetical protein